MWFKLATLTFKALHTGRPPYPCDLLQYHESMRSLHSSSTHQLSVPRHNLPFGSRAFRFSAPRVWNSESQSLLTFRRHLKTFHFIFSQPTPFSCPPCLDYLRPRALILLRLWRYISHLLTYLLTISLPRIVRFMHCLTHVCYAVTNIKYCSLYTC